ncbi:flagellar cap protein FliD [Paracidovorax avenae]|uniref:flagellar filament capping protein FliD n=1 Tax=Paracidovorax avenae TaxID=80867 RepID=UPI000D179D42|nr:flagellar filament capping protein FliD [Paracidovorax avenae]AVS89912.1 flagellar cap protein FliD [Paracidovorax avenae]
MPSFSSLGIGLGGNVNVNDLIKVSVDAVKLPITRTNGLTQQAAVTNAKVSAFGQLKSLVSTLSDAASKLTSVTGWNGVAATSSSTDSVTVSAVGGAAATSFNVQVQNLAKAQSSISDALTPAKSPVGAGTLTLTTGTWSGSPKSFAAGQDPAVNIDVSATDTLEDVASKINGSKAGVTATVLTDASGQRLMLRSKTTGESAGYQLGVTDADGSNTDSSGLSRVLSGSTEYAQNANATVNGVAVTSGTNVFANAVAGVTFTAVKPIATDVSITVSKDNSAVKANIQAFITAYNAVNSALNDATKYDKDTKTAGLLQGDSSAVTLQNTLRMTLQSVNQSGAFRALSDVGVVSAGGAGNLSPDGSLTLDSTKFDKAMQSPDDVKAFFRGADGGSVTDGFAGKLQAVTSKLLGSDGFFASKDQSYKDVLKRNAADIERITDRASEVEKNLTARYTALDTKMSTINQLNSYIQQQVVAWNKTL